MGTYIIICILAIVTIGVVITVMKVRKRRASSENPKTFGALALKNQTSISPGNKFEMEVTFESLPALTENQNSKLVEIKDEKLLARINSTIPGTFQVVASTGAATGANEILQQSGQLYRAVIPHGAVLDHSKEMMNAYRGSFRDAANRIKGNANWIPVDTSSAKGIAAVNVTSAAMGVASMVVGQYYMSQITEQIGEIADSLNSIASFQDNEYKSKVYTLVAEVQKTSNFQMEIMENDELRKRELQHLKELETKCAELLNQANITLDSFSNRTDVDYETYEPLVGRAYSWYQYQQVLLQVMYKISDLTHALNLGLVSKKYSYALFLPHAKQSTATQDRLIAWHETVCERLEIDVDAAWRKRQGVEGFFMSILGVVNDDFNYKALPKSTVQMIRKQSGDSSLTGIKEEDLFRENVQLIAKDGKLYYLPVVEQPEYSD